jgi:G:T-mismatch repair DNA endonuclease (very short patch repair protein)
MWLLYREKVDGIKILHARNRRVYRLPELPHLSMDGFCPEQRKVLEFLGCFWDGHTCLPFRDVTTMCGDTLSQRYEQTPARIEQITRAGYQVEIK